MPNAAIPGRWVNAIDLRVGDILFTRDGRRVPVTNVSVRHVNTSNPTPQGRWQWTPSRATPQPPRPGGTAPHGDIPELIQHVRQIRGQGATAAEAEQAWVDGMRIIDQRAAQFPGNGPVVNDFFGVVSGEWRVYVGRPPVAGGDAFALAFNTRTAAIAQGRLLNIRPHPTIPFSILLSSIHNTASLTRGETRCRRSTITRRCSFSKVSVMNAPEVR